MTIKMMALLRFGFQVGNVWTGFCEKWCYDELVLNSKRLETYDGGHYCLEFDAADQIDAKSGCGWKWAYGNPSLVVDTVFLQILPISSNLVMPL